MRLDIKLDRTQIFKLVLGLVMAVFFLRTLGGSMFQCVSKKMNSHPAPPPAYHVNDGKYPPAVQEFLAMRDRVCNGGVDFNKEWEGWLPRTMHRLTEYNEGHSGALVGETNYGGRCANYEPLDDDNTTNSDSRHYHTQVQKWMAILYRASAASGQDNSFCKAKIVGWTDEYHARTYRHWTYPMGIVGAHMSSYIDARCRLRLRKDGTLVGEGFTKRDAEICQIYRGQKNPLKKLYWTVKTVDIVLEFPNTGKNHIWSMYYRNPTTIEKTGNKRDGWALLEVDKNFCMRYYRSVSFEGVATRMGGEGFHVDQFHPEWLERYWKLTGQLKGSFAPVDNGYKPGDDYFDPLAKWYYRVGSPYHKTF